MADYREIRDIEKILDGLDIVLRLNPVRHSLVEDTDITKDGLIAHEVQEVGLDHAVVGEKDADEMQKIDYGMLVPVIVAALQELRQEVVDIRKSIEDIKNGF